MINRFAAFALFATNAVVVLGQNPQCGPTQCCLEGSCCGEGSVWTTDQICVPNRTPNVTPCFYVPKDRFCNIDGPDGGIIEKPCVISPVCAGEGCCGEGLVFVADMMRDKFEDGTTTCMCANPNWKTVQQCSSNSDCTDPDFSTCCFFGATDSSYCTQSDTCAAGGGSVTPIVPNFQPDSISSVNGTLEVTLDVSFVESLTGIPWSDTRSRIAAGYNGKPIGPTLRVKPGDTLTVTINNNLPPPSALDQELYAYVLDTASDENNATTIINRLSNIGNPNEPEFGFWGRDYVNLHFHGMQFSPAVEDILQFVDGGSSKTYSFELPADQQPGTYWYHDHVHGTSSAAYMAGLFGFIIVEGTLEEGDYTKAPGVEGAREVLLMLSEGLVNPDGSVPPTFPIVMQFDWTSVANGQLPAATVHRFKQGETALFRATSASVEPTLRLTLPNHIFTIVAIDGRSLPSPIETDLIEIEGGARVDFVVRFDQPGSFVLTRAAWSPIPPGVAGCMLVFNIPVAPCVSYDVEREILTIVVESDANPVAPLGSVELPGDNARLTALAQVTPSDTKTVTMEQKNGFPLFQIPYDGPFVPPGVGFGMSGRFFNPNFFHGSVAAGTCETWTVLTLPPGGEGHPFHAHTSVFRVLNLDGVDVPEPYWADSLLVRSNATLHICFDRLQEGERNMVHCHMASHLDIGMAMQFQTIAAPP